MSDFSARRVTMVDTQIRPSDVTKFPIIAAMLAVPRELYVPTEKREAAYMDGNLEIHPGRSILEPRSFAKLLDVLNIQPDEVVLDIGCGLGYSTAVIARLADAVVAVECEAELADLAQQNLSQQSVDNAAVMAGPLELGAEKHGPYDVIIMQGGIEALPAPLENQLKDGGRIAAIFMQDGLGVAKIGNKLQGKIHWRMAFNATAPMLRAFEKPRSFHL